MAIKYESRYHSDDDPGGLIREVLELGPEFPGPAPDILLAWMLRLGEDQDPATIAGRLLKNYQVDAGPIPDGACGELVKLLRETATYGADRLIARSNKRRGRRR